MYTHQHEFEIVHRLCVPGGNLWVDDLGECHHDHRERTAPEQKSYSQ